MRGIIFAKDLDKGNVQLLDIAQRYEMLQIDTQIRRLKHGFTLECANGDYWSVRSANVRACGARCNIAYVERSIDLETYRCEIAPCLTNFPYSAIRLWGEGNLHIDDCPMLPF